MDWGATKYTPCTAANFSATTLALATERVVAAARDCARSELVLDFWTRALGSRVSGTPHFFSRAGVAISSGRGYERDDRVE